MGTFQFMLIALTTAKKTIKMRKLLSTAAAGTFSSGSFSASAFCSTTTGSAATGSSGAGASTKIICHSKHGDFFDENA